MRERVSAIQTRHLSAALAIFACLALAPPLRGDASAQGRSPAPPLPLAGSYELPPIGAVRDRMLRNAEGSREAWLDLKPGQAAVVSLVYTSCPHACPIATAALQRLDAELAELPALRDRARLVTISFDPSRDTPERMRAYRDALRPKTHWRFLTAASPAEIQPVLDDLGQDVEALIGPDGEESPLLGHVLRVYLVDDQRSIRNIYNSGFLTAEVMLLDLETLLLHPAPPRHAATP